ncbi:GNAT family N-acetyltransferase [Chryseobacterium fistulae]|uniref:Phosphinothricin acetyltransferase YwnH n=1 Tax=Chryseobacterium fistulae TaxID=2675058 RepID=A0A6N4XLF2_9FLAO|nr:GNAT family N-acetyltransferase [Chryseobacterium fistulae]CAA7386587.1 Putative phosphinothricin acetyltransferase YwnH [Chryseobacterium fistulae]
MEIISINKNHYPDIANIYKQGIDTGIATFETSVSTWESWNESKLLHSRFVGVDKNNVLGWVALSKVSNRCVYEGVAEVSIYVSENHRRKGVGKILMENVIKESEANGIWTLQSGMFVENEATIALHQIFGFRIIGYREKIGKLGGVWKDTVIMERRSKIIGID